MIKRLRDMRVQFIEDCSLDDRPRLNKDGHWIVGVGWNISKRGIPAYAASEVMHSATTHAAMGNDIVYLLLDELFTEAVNAVKTQLLQRYTSISEARKCALVRLCFHAGKGGFTKMWAAIEENDWETAAHALRTSTWARQNGLYADGIAKVMEEG